MGRNLTKVTEIELRYKRGRHEKNNPVIINSESAYRLFRSHWNMGQIELIEEFKFLLLNRQREVLGLVNHAKGGAHEVIVDPKLIFAAALKSGASSIILAHNHPGGNLNASEADCTITENLQKGAMCLGMDILDHLILTKTGWMSFANDGLL